MGWLDHVGGLRLAGLLCTGGALLMLALVYEVPLGSYDQSYDDCGQGACRHLDETFGLRPRSMDYHAMVSHEGASGAWQHSRAPASALVVHDYDQAGTFVAGGWILVGAHAILVAAGVLAILGLVAPRGLTIAAGWTLVAGAIALAVAGVLILISAAAVIEDVAERQRDGALAAGFSVDGDTTPRTLWVAYPFVAALLAGFSAVALLFGTIRQPQRSLGAWQL